jgi:crotonobetainyl-CoA:carnitine CoA-transferase CaiB-like acyl-CoA transferase
MVSLPLEGIRVLDCSGLIPGPYCTMMLADLGAEVIKVERPGVGDFMRSMSPASYNYMNGNKKLITLDLKHKQGVDLLLKLAETCAIFVEGFRPGVVKRLGIDFDRMKAVNPSIIYCSISGYGQTGPDKDLPGHDINYQGRAALFSIAGNPDIDFEFPSGIQTADIAGSMFALASILAALVRPKDSSPVYLDISMMESMAMWVMPRFMEYLDRNRPPKNLLMGRGPYGIFKTQDNKYLSLGIVEDRFWINLCNVLGFEDWASDESLRGWVVRNEQRNRIVPRLKTAIKEKNFDYWMHVFTQADIPVAPVNDFDDWTDDPQFLHKNFIPKNAAGEIDHNNLRRFPVNFLSGKPDRKEKEPVLGRDTEDMFHGIGLSSEEIRKLKDKKVI